MKSYVCRIKTLKTAQLINPWIEFCKSLDETNLILSEEKNAIEQFNKVTSEEFKIHTEIMPAPFMGDVHNASIVILMLNPRYDPKEEKRGFYSEYKHFWKNEIQHTASIPHLPLFCLDERYCEYSPYWSGKLKPIISAVGKDKVAKNISKIQFFPYHSKKYKPISKKLLKNEGFEKYLPSQEYNFQLVREAIYRNAIIVIPRAVKIWEKAIPELKNYQKKFSTNSYGNIILSEKNLGNGYSAIIENLNQD